MGGKRRGRVENLRTPTTEEAREIGHKGGIASGEARREKATLLKWAMALRDAPNPDAKNPTDGETQGAAVIASMYREGRRGNVQAAKFLAELMRECDAQSTVSFASPIVINPFDAEWVANEKKKQEEAAKIEIGLPSQSRLDEIAKHREERNARDERELNGR